MSGEKNLELLLKNMQPELILGDYVFCQVDDISLIDLDKIVLFFREKEAITLVLKKETADDLQLPYNFVAAWICLKVHSSLEAVGLTAAFSTALAKEDISCNVVAAFYHDHIFVAKNEAEKAIGILNKFACN
jgi:uncharacterized protein